MSPLHLVEVVHSICSAQNGLPILKLLAFTCRSNKQHKFLFVIGLLVYPPPSNNIVRVTKVQPQLLELRCQQLLHRPSLTWFHKMPYHGRLPRIQRSRGVYLGLIELEMKVLINTHLRTYEALELFVVVAEAEDLSALCDTAPR